MTVPEIKTIPEIRFAHKYTADSHHLLLPVRENIIEISVVTEGALRVSGNGFTGTALAGDTVVNRYLTPMQIDAEAPHSHRTVCFSIDEGFSDAALPVLIRSDRSGPRTLRLIDEIIRVHTISPDDRLRTAGLFLQLLGELLSALSQPSGASPGDSLYVKRAKEYIYEHITEPIVQRDVAVHLGISPEYLCALFKKAEGRSLIRMVNEIKLDNIRDLIRNKGLSLSQAAAQYGFSDPNYVSKLFRKYYDTTAVR